MLPAGLSVRAERRPGGGQSWWLGDVGGAENAFRRSLELDPDGALAIKYYARLLDHTGRREEAERLVSDALERRPGDSELMTELDSYRPPAVPQRRLDAGEQLGRNEPCWCGSGKKFKKCHGS